MRTLKKLILLFLPFSRTFMRFKKCKLQAGYIDFLKFKLHIERRYWPAHKNCVIANQHNIFVGINALIGRPGNYIQGAGKVYIGNYVRLAPNVGILSANHDLYDQRISKKERVIIGDYTWIGMNSVILPGVTLGTRTIVAAGSVVTKSFPEGFCVVGGTPAKLIKVLDKDKFSPWRDDEEFYGFVPKEEFEKSKFYQDNFIKNDEVK